MEGAQQPRPPQQTARVTVTDIDMAAAFGAGLIFGLMRSCAYQELRATTAWHRHEPAISASSATEAPNGAVGPALQPAGTTLEITTSTTDIRDIPSVATTTHAPAADPPDVKLSEDDLAELRRFRDRAKIAANSMSTRVGGSTPAEPAAPVVVDHSDHLAKKRAMARAEGLVFLDVEQRVYHEADCQSAEDAMPLVTPGVARNEGYQPATDCHAPVRKP